MKKLITMSAIFGIALLVPTIEVDAKCFVFRGAPRTKICVPGSGSSARRKAGKICKRIKGRRCGSIAGYSGSCRKGRYTCYNRNGQRRKYIRSR